MGKNRKASNASLTVGSKGFRVFNDTTKKGTTSAAAISLPKTVKMASAAESNNTSAPRARWADAVLQEAE